MNVHKYQESQHNYFIFKAGHPIYNKQTNKQNKTKNNNKTRQYVKL